MKIGGIIAEYNPFHNGHKYHLEKFKIQDGCTHLVAVLSGNFIQRGGPAIFDKYKRTEFALKSGIDLVVEMPSHFATQTAELFARGAILTLDSLKCVNSIGFGSESGNIEDIQRVVDFINNRKSEYNLGIKKYLNMGFAFPVAREKSIRKYIKLQDNFLREPNNILAIEYINEIIRLNADFKPVTIKRFGSGHNEKKINTHISSATAIREFLLKYKDYDIANQADVFNDFFKELKDNIPIFEAEDIKKLFENNVYPMCCEDFFDNICISILKEDNNLHNFFEVVEGLENSIRKKIVVSKDFDNAINLISSKRYTISKIRRCLFNILLGVKTEDIRLVKKIRLLPYIRVLGFNEKGIEILKRVKKSSEADIIMSPAKAKKNSKYNSDFIYKKLLDFDLKSSRIYYQKYYSNNRNILQKGEPDYLNLVRFI